MQNVKELIYSGGLTDCWLSCLYFQMDHSQLFKSSAKTKKKVVVLDRPNPLGNKVIEEECGKVKPTRLLGCFLFPCAMV